jgi:hypothetical protein
MLVSRRLGVITPVRRSSKRVGELLKGTGFRPSVNLPNDTRL